MKRTIVVAGVLIGLLSIIAAPCAFAGDPPTTVTIKAIQDKQPPVTFPHKTHADKLKAKCADCHTTAAGDALKPALTDAKGKGQMKNAFHTQCLDCHKKEKGPTTCTTCHKK